MGFEILKFVKLVCILLCLIFIDITANRKCVSRETHFNMKCKCFLKTKYYKLLFSSSNIGPEVTSRNFAKRKINMFNSKPVRHKPKYLHYTTFFNMKNSVLIFMSSVFLSMTQK